VVNALTELKIQSDLKRTLEENGNGNNH
jgi:hypothetical protein